MSAAPKSAVAVILVSLCFFTRVTAQVSTPRLVAAHPDAALDAQVVDRFVATTSRQVTRALAAEVIARGVASGLIARGTEDLGNVGLGVVTFKATAANAQAFQRANAALFTSVEAEQRFSIARPTASARASPPPPPRASPPPYPPSLILSDTCSTVTDLWGLDVLCVPKNAMGCTAAHRAHRLRKHSWRRPRSDH